VAEKQGVVLAQILTEQGIFRFGKAFYQRRQALYQKQAMKLTEIGNKHGNAQP
jgi:hypothetical protein